MHSLSECENVACIKGQSNKHTSCEYLGLITKQLKRDRIGNFERQSTESKCCLVELKIHPHVLHAHPRQIRAKMQHAMPSTGSTFDAESL